MKQVKRWNRYRVFESHLTMTCNFVTVCQTVFGPFRLWLDYVSNFKLDLNWTFQLLNEINITHIANVKYFYMLINILPLWNYTLFCQTFTRCLFVKFGHSVCTNDVSGGTAITKIYSGINLPSVLSFTLLSKVPFLKLKGIKNYWIWRRYCTAIPIYR